MGGGEEKLVVRNSRKVYIPIYMMVVILFVVMAVIKFQGKEINDILFTSVIFFSLAMMIGTEFSRMRNTYEITGDMIAHIHGLIFQRIKKIDIHSLSDAQFKQNPLQMILGIGDVTANVFSEMTVMKNIDKPHEVIKFLEDRMTRKAQAVTTTSGRRKE